MSLRDRILPIQTEPEQVERAPRGERMKRDAWLIASTLGTMGILAVPFSMFLSTYDLPPEPYPALIAIAWFIGSLWASQPVFEWGVRRWELVVPWQFREAEQIESER